MFLNSILAWSIFDFGNFEPIPLSLFYPRLHVHNLAYVVLNANEALQPTILEGEVVALLSKVANLAIDP